MLKKVQLGSVLLIVSFSLNIYFIYDYFSVSKLKLEYKNRIIDLQKKSKTLNLKYNDLEAKSNILRVKDSIQTTKIDSMRKIIKHKKIELVNIKKTLTEIETSDFRNIDNDSIINVLKRTRF